MNDVAAVVLLLLIVPALVIVGLLVSARPRTWSNDHAIAARWLGIVGGALGVAVAAFWAGRFVQWW